MAASVLSFAGAAAAAIIQSCLLFLELRRASSLQYNKTYEHKFRALRWARTLTYVALCVCQAALVLWHAASHWPQLAWGIDGSQMLVLAVYCLTLGVLCLKWHGQLSLQLSSVLLIALLEPGLLFWQDITGVQPDGTFDSEHVARVILHCVQFVLLLCLLVAEVIIQQHQLLLKSNFGSSSTGTLPVAAQHKASYQRLPGSAADAGDKEKQQQSGRQKEKFSAWRPGDTRFRMAASAFHYVWPAEGTLRLRLMLCMLLVLSERVINLAAPIAFKHMVEVLSAVVSAPAEPEGQQGGNLVAGLRHLLMYVGGQHAQLQPQHSAGLSMGVLGAAANSTVATAAAPAGAGLFGFLQSDVLAPFWVLFYPWVFVYLGAFFLRGGSGSEGLLANLRDILWIPITQAAFRRISNDVFEHLLELDLSFHVHRKTGQIMRILDRGTSSIQDTVSIILFNVLPQLIDILVACTYLASALKGPWVALIVLFTVGSYVPLTLLITEQRGKVRKVMNALDNERESRATDMLLNYETIKYFTAENAELSGYDTATRKYQAAEYWQMAFLSLLSLVQSLVVWVGLAAGLVYCVWGSSRGRVSVGDTVLFISMMQQLYVPLTFFGSYYRQVTKALIDMENMFELLATEPRVQDEPHAATLQVSNGTVEFKQVIFSYNPSPTNPPVLRGLSFHAPGGRSLAVVGSTGSGKSTLLRLLLRFYDPQSGCILIDGQDIRCCSQASVRGAIGVVPQDCVLFNDTIMYNIRYARPGASDGQVHEAAQVGHIHDHLMRFPQGYSTRVGERGLRLSGGEKQRVAFARAVLKAPAIMVLDEATSSLDSLTERMIQDSLAKIRGTCTQVIVAHRLSTIMDADQILVLAKGAVVESGTHAALVAAGGLYASMWARQQDSSSTLPSPTPKPGRSGNNSTNSSRGSLHNPTTDLGGDLTLPDGSITAGSKTGPHDSSRTQQQHVHGEVEEEAAAGDSQPEPRGSLSGVQSPPPSLPPLPRMQRRLQAQPEQRESSDGTEQQQHLGEPASSAGPGSRHVSRTNGQAAAVRAAGASPEVSADGEADSRPARARSVDKLRCNSSCGHGRHANFWSREQVEEHLEQEDDDGLEQQEEQEDGSTDRH